MRATTKKRALKNRQRGEESKPRKHRATGQPRGGKREGAGRKDSPLRMGMVFTSPWSPRTVDRMCRIARHSPLLFDQVAGGRHGWKPAQAERFIQIIERALFLNKPLVDELRDDPIVLEIQAAFKARRAKMFKSSPS